jgi:hypothetical protein
MLQTAPPGGSWEWYADTTRPLAVAVRGSDLNRLYYRFYFIYLSSHFISQTVIWEIRGSRGGEDVDRGWSSGWWHREGLKMEAECSSETFLPSNKHTRHHNAEGHDRHTAAHRRSSAMTSGGYEHCRLSITTLLLNRCSTAPNSIVLKTPDVKIPSTQQIYKYKAWLINYFSLYVLYVSAKCHLQDA